MAEEQLEIWCYKCGKFTPAHWVGWRGSHDELWCSCGTVVGRVVFVPNVGAAGAGRKARTR